MNTLSPTRQASNRRTAFFVALAGLFMLGLGFASVPLYRLFCQVTGYGGTTQRVSEAQGEAATQPLQGATRQLSIRFDSNIRNGLPWNFYPEKKTVSVGVGGKSMAIFIAKNLSDKPVTGRAVFNVTPEFAGPYFTKIECFCFTEQTLKPGQEVRMPVLFYVDKKIMDDPDNKDVQEITLSYTFYPVEKPENDS